MHRPSFRSALGRTTRGVLPTAGFAASSARNPLSIATAAFFSSTPSQAVLKNVTGRQDRLAAAASEVSSLNSDSKGRSGTAPQQTDAPRPVGSNPHFSSSGPTNDDNGSSASGRSGGIINIRSLPRKLSGGPRGFPGPGVSNANTSAGRINTNPAFQQGGASGPGRFVGTPRGGRGGSAGRGRGRGRRRRFGNREDGDEANAAREKPEDDALTPEMIEYLVKEDMGEYSDFEPVLTLDGLLGHRPAVVSTQGDATGSVAMALRSMRVMSGGHAFGGGQEEGASSLSSVPNAEGLRERLHKGETVFFDTALERSMVDAALHSATVRKRLELKKIPVDTTLIAPINEATKEAILDTAIRGVYTGPNNAAKDPAMSGTLLETFHRYQAKDYTYTEEHQRNFDAKILDLLPNASEAKAGKRGKAAKA